MTNKCPKGFTYLKSNWKHECVPIKFVALKKRAKKLGLKVTYGVGRYAGDTEDRTEYEFYGYNPRRYMKFTNIKFAEQYIKKQEGWKKASCKKLKSELKTMPEGSRGYDIIKYELDKRCR